MQSYRTSDPNQEIQLTRQNATKAHTVLGGTLKYTRQQDLISYSPSTGFADSLESLYADPAHTTPYFLFKMLAENKMLSDSQAQMYRNTLTHLCVGSYDFFSICFNRFLREVQRWNRDSKRARHSYSCMNYAFAPRLHCSRTPSLD